MRSFRKALFAALGFFLCVALIAEGIVWPYFHGQFYYYEDAEVRDELAGSVDCLISGASHAYSAFDPRVLDEELGTNSYNLSGALMTMCARDTLLRKELDRNPVKTVFIELSCNTLTRNREQEGPEGDIYALSRMGSLWDRCTFFFRAFYPDEYLEVCANTLDHGFDSWYDLRHGVPPTVDASCKGFRSLEHTDLSMTPEEFSALHHTTAMSEAIWQENKEYFQDMVETCQERGIEVVFVTTPLSDRMIAEYHNLEAAHQWYLDYAQKYHCTYLDFNLYRQREELFPSDTAFYDTYHLGSQGAVTFTRELSKLYKRIQAGEDVSSLFYADYDALDDAMCKAYGAS